MTRALLPTVLLALLPAAACGPGGPPPAPRSALLITLDTTRADALGAFGGRPGLTPHLDRLAAESVVFERAFTVTPLTLPAHASMLTGLIPPRHGLRQNGASRLPAAAETLAERARAAGLETAAFTASVVLDPAFGLDQGFELYDAPSHALQQATTHYSSRLGPEMVQRVEAWFEARDPGRPFFLWVHLWDPHGPFEPPPEFAQRAPDSPYLGEVAAVDDAVGRLLAALELAGQDDETTVLVVADHGEAFWEHGEYSHGSYCWDTTLRVPLLLRSPGDPRLGTRVSTVASVADVTPTLAAALGLPPLEGLDGHDLCAPLAADRGAYFESYYGYLAYDWSPLAGWVDDRGKYLHSSRPVLFDPRSDPSESEDLLPGDPAAGERYRQAIAQALAGPPLAPDTIASGTTLDLGSLGYADVAAALDLPHPLEPTDRPSPLERVEEQRLTLEAQTCFNEGRYADAERIHLGILAKNPGNLHSLARLGITRIRQRRHAEAIAPLERACQSGRAGAGAWVNLGTALRVIGDAERARGCFEEALALDGSQVRAVRHLIDLHAAAGRAAELADCARLYEKLTGETVSIGEPQ